MSDRTSTLSLRFFVKFRSLTRSPDQDGEQFQHVECECGHRQYSHVGRWASMLAYVCGGCGYMHARSGSHAARRLRDREASQ